MFSNVALSGGAHLCVAFIGFLRSARPALGSVRNVVGTSGGAIVALAFALDLPDDLALGIIIRHAGRGLVDDMDIASLLDAFGLVSTEAKLRPMVLEMLSAGVRRWHTIKNGWAPAEGADEDQLARMSLGEVAKLTGVNLAVCVTDVSQGFRSRFLGADTSPHVSVVDAVCASCAIPLVFTPVVIDGVPYVDGGVQSSSPLPYLSQHSATGGADTLSVEVEFFNDVAAGQPRDLYEFGTNLMCVLLTSGRAAQRRVDADGLGACATVTIPTWKGRHLSSLMTGVTAADVSGAYEHGVRSGVQFLHQQKIMSPLL